MNATITFLCTQCFEPCPICATQFVSPTLDGRVHRCLCGRAHIAEASHRSLPLPGAEGPPPQIISVTAAGTRMTRSWALPGRRGPDAGADESTGSASGYIRTLSRICDALDLRVERMRAYHITLTSKLNRLIPSAGILDAILDLVELRSNIITSSCAGEAMAIARITSSPTGGER